MQNTNEWRQFISKNLKINFRLLADLQGTKVTSYVNNLDKHKTNTKQNYSLYIYVVLWRT